MNMKKIAILALSLCMVAAIAVTGTIAYFTDTDEATNVFTTSKVSIDLKENFEDDSLLKPGMDVTKEAWIVNDGDQDAWVWAEVLIPVQLDDGIANSPDAPGLKNSLHFNYPGAYSEGHAQNTNAEGKYYNADLTKLWNHQYSGNNVKYGYAGKEKVGEVEYNKYVKFYTEKLAANTGVTSNFMSKVYMDKTVAQTETEGTYKLVDGSTYAGNWELIVRAYGIQAEGFKDVYEAWNAYDGAKPGDANFAENGKD